MIIEVEFEVFNKIRVFYENMQERYPHVWGDEEIENLVDKCVDGIDGIETKLIRREPTLKKWNGLHMATFQLNDKAQWNYAYKIENDKIIVMDAEHSQNMKESIRYTFDNFLSEYYQKWYNMLYR